MDQQAVFAAVSQSGKVSAVDFADGRTIHKGNKGMLREVFGKGGSAGFQDISGDEVIVIGDGVTGDIAVGIFPNIVGEKCKDDGFGILRDPGSRPHWKQRQDRIIRTEPTLRNPKRSKNPSNQIMQNQSPP